MKINCAVSCPVLINGPDVLDNKYRITNERILTDTSTKFLEMFEYISITRLSST